MCNGKKVHSRFADCRLNREEWEREKRKTTSWIKITMKTFTFTSPASCRLCMVDYFLLNTILPFLLQPISICRSRNWKQLVNVPLMVRAHYLGSFRDGFNFACRVNFQLNLNAMSDNNVCYGTFNAYYHRWALTSSTLWPPKFSPPAPQHTYNCTREQAIIIIQ